MSQLPRVFIYARFSSDMQNPMSVRDQIARCKDDAARRGWRVVRTFSDAAMTGTREDRPEFQAMQDAVRRRECDIVLAESLDRLSRDPEHMARFYKEAQHADAKIFTLDRGEIDLVQLGFQSTFGALYLEMLADKTRRGLAGKVKDGKSAGGLSYGYLVPVDERNNRIVGQLIINEEEAAIVRRIFREYAEGRSPLKIAAGLNADGVSAPRSSRGASGHWKQNTINGNRERGTGILNNELYIGRRVWNRLKYRKDPATGRRVSRLNPESEWQTEAVPHLRIVDDALWNAARERQSRMEKVRSKREAHDPNGLSASRSLKRRKFLLSGLLRCGVCGGNMTVAGSGDAKRYYCANAKEKGKTVCPGMPGLPIGQAEDHVLGQMRDHLMNDAAYQAFKRSFLRQWTENQKAAVDTTRVKDKAIQRLAKEREGLMTAIKRGIATDELLKELEAVGSALERAKADKEAAIPQAVSLPEDLPERYRGYVEDLVATLNDEGVVGRASDLLHDLIDRVVVRYEKESRTFDIIIDGNIVKMLTAADPAQGGAYTRSQSSLELVAGAGFEPAAFRL